MIKKNPGMDFEEFYKSDENWKFFNDFSENDLEKNEFNEIYLICSICRANIDSNFFFFCKECNFFLCKLCSISFSVKSNTFCICNDKNKEIYSSLAISEFPLFENDFDSWISKAFVDYIKIMTIFYAFAQDRSQTDIFRTYRFFNVSFFTKYTSFSSVRIFKKSINNFEYNVLLQIFANSIYCSSLEFDVRKFVEFDSTFFEFKKKYENSDEISSYICYIISEIESVKYESTSNIKRKLKFIINI